MDFPRIKSIVEALLRHLSIPFDEIGISEEADITRVDIKSSDPSRLIGWHGETLNAMQHLTKSIIRTAEKLEKSPFIVLDVDGYRRAQEDRVRRMAEQKADFVRRTGSRVVLAPMSPYFRRIVHLHVANTADLQDLTTESTGEGDYRQIVLRLKDEGGIRSDEELSPVIVESGGEDDLGNLDV